MDSGNEIIEHGSSCKQKRLLIAGDSILKGIKEKGFSKKRHIVKVRLHAGAISEDLEDLIKPGARGKPGVIVLHIGTNDITNDLKTRD